MKTDAEITRLVAEKVMQWREEEFSRIKWWTFPDSERKAKGYGGISQAGFAPLTDWSAAGQIVEKMRADGWLADIEIRKETAVLFYRRHAVDIRHRTRMESFPRAATLAALTALGVEL